MARGTFESDPTRFVIEQVALLQDSRPTHGWLRVTLWCRIWLRTDGLLARCTIAAAISLSSWVKRPS